MTMEALRAELLADIEAHAKEQLADHGISPEVAEQIGCALADHLADRFGGQVFTMPKDHAYRLSKRDHEILERHRHGARLDELSREYGLCVRAIRKLLARAIRRSLVDNQLDLFSVPKDAAA